MGHKSKEACTSRIQRLNIISIVGHESAVNTVKFLPLQAATTFVTGSDDATINLWDLRMREPIA